MTPPVQLVGSAVLLQDNGVGIAYYLVSEGIWSCRKRGASVPPNFVGLQRALSDAVQVAKHGHLDVQSGGDEPETESIDAREAAETLGLSRRAIYRLAGELGGFQHPNGRWTFDRSAVAAYASTRGRDPGWQRTQQDRPHST